MSLWTSLLRASVLECGSPLPLFAGRTSLRDQEPMVPIASPDQSARGLAHSKTSRNPNPSHARSRSCGAREVRSMILGGGFQRQGCPGLIFKTASLHELIVHHTEGTVFCMSLWTSLLRASVLECGSPLPLFAGRTSLRDQEPMVPIASPDQSARGLAHSKTSRNPNPSHARSRSCGAREVRSMILGGGFQRQDGPWLIFKAASLHELVVHHATAASQDSGRAGSWAGNGRPCG